MSTVVDILITVGMFSTVGVSYKCGGYLEYHGVLK